MKETARPGFTYLVELLRNGEVYHAEEVHNRMPVEGLNHLIEAALRAGTQTPSWYVGVYSSTYAPTADDKAATFAAAAGELTGYTPATRPLLVLGAPVGGSADNFANRAEFTFTAPATVRGAFIVSSATKQGTGGLLISAALFATPKAPVAGDVLRVTAGFDFISS